MGRPEAIALGVALVLAGCRSPEIETPLVESTRPPEVLVESERVAMEPTATGTRFLAGWRPVGRGKQKAMVPIGAASRIELATVAPRPRKLVLWGDHEGGAGREVMVVAGGEPWQLALQFPLEIEVPETVSAGRTVVELRFPAGVQVFVRRAEVQDVVPAGTIRIGEEGSISQNPWSVALLPFRAPGRGVVSGVLELPADAGADSFYEAWIDRADGSTRRLVAWRGTEAAGVVPFDAAVALNERARLRLIAGGDGPPARWTSLVLSTRTPPPGPEPETAPRTPRLVLVYVMDALRADHVGHLGGDPRLTPRLDELAREGGSFTDHRATAPSTLASTVALFTGRPSVATGPLEPIHGTTLAERFQQAGWRTACISGNPNVADDLGTTRGFEHVVLTELDHSRGFASELNNSSERVVEAAEQWAAGLAPEERGFLYVHAINPHNPYSPPAPWTGRFTTRPAGIGGDTVTLVGIRDGKLMPSTDEQVRLGELYGAGVAYADDRFGSLVDALRRRFGEDRVLVIATSDHGEELFDHDGVLHGYTLYEEMLRIPLVVAWPGVVAARRIDLPTDQLDLHATLERLAGDERGSGTGRSLWGLLVGSSWDLAPRLRFAAASRAAGEMVGVVDGRWKVVLTPRNGRTGGLGFRRGRSWDPEMIFDLSADPDERFNLVGADRVEWTWLRSSLRGWAATLDDGGPTDNGSIDAATRDSLRALGYIE